MSGSQLIAKIAVSSAVMSIDKLYSYIVPADFHCSITAGQRVIVPFGRNNASAQGFVVELESQSADKCEKLKTI